MVTARSTFDRAADRAAAERKRIDAGSTQELLNIGEVANSAGVAAVGRCQQPSAIGIIANQLVVAGVPQQRAAYGAALTEVKAIVAGSSADTARENAPGQ